ncbi:MAG: OmpA family protein [Spirochaetaceae bacterium]|nr:OmpA family protein [Spirochaetaceae bacterium]
MKRLIFFLLAFSAAILPAQTAAEVEAILSTQAVSFTQASRFTLVVADLVDEAAGAGAAYSLALERSWLPRRALAEAASPESPIKLGELCFLIVEAFGIKSSFLYHVLPGPHYAFRELDYLKLIPGQRDPGMNVSGERLLQILGMVAAYTQEGRETEEAPAPMTAEAAEQPEEKPAPVAAAATPVPAEAPAPVPAVTRPEERPAPVMAAIAKPEERPVPVMAAERPEKPPDAEKSGIIGLGNIRFRTDSAELRETEKARLRDIAALLPDYPDRKILIGGYTALAGNMRGRLQVSMERARTVADFLLSLGACLPEEIIVQAYGAQRPVGDNARAEGRAANRRVEIILLDEAYYRIQFPPDSAELTEAGKAKLRELASALSRYSGVDILVGGYTALAGSQAGRVRISMERARAVADFLAALDPPGARNIAVRSYGAARPLGDNASEEGRAINRRVEITLLDE